MLSVVSLLFIGKFLGAVVFFCALLYILFCRVEWSDTLGATLCLLLGLAVFLGIFVVEKYWKVRKQSAQTVSSGLTSHGGKK